MLGVTLFGLLLSPVFYVVLRKLGAGIPVHSSGMARDSMLNILPRNQVSSARAIDFQPCKCPWSCGR